MTNYKKLPYTIRAKFTKLDGGTPTGEKWTENLSIMYLPDNFDITTFSETYVTIINSFKNLLSDVAYAYEDQEAVMGAITIGELAAEIAEDPTAGITTDGDTVNFSLNLRMFTNIGDTPTSKIPGYWHGSFDSDTVPLLDTFTRNLVNLSTNTYNEVVISAVIKPLEGV